MGILLGGRGARATTFASSLIVLLALLTACTAGPPASPTRTATDAAPGSPAPQTEDEAGAPFAAVTLAGVDVDGANLTVGGFVGQVDESGGTCTYVIMSVVSGVTVSAVTTGVENGTTTSCGSAKISMSELSKGPWTVQLDYQSPAVEVSSPPLEVELP